MPNTPDPQPVCEACERPIPPDEPVHEVTIAVHEEPDYWTVDTLTLCAACHEEGQP